MLRNFSLARKLLTLLPFLFLLGSGLLLFFMLLSGASSSSNLLLKFYWIKAKTPGLGKYSETKWTNYRLCNAVVGGECGSSTAGLPISPKDNFSGASGKIGNEFIKSRNSFYYESRVGWLFLLISAFFVILAILMSIPSLCLSSTILVTLSWVMTLIAFVFIAVSALLYTHILTKAKRAFKKNGQSAHIGTKMMAFLWTTVLLLLLSTFFTFLLGCFQFASNRYESNGKEKDSELYDSDEDTYNDGLLNPVPIPQQQTQQQPVQQQQTTKPSFWKRRSSTNNAVLLGGGAGAGAGAGAGVNNTNVSNSDYHPAGVISGGGATSNTNTVDTPSKINFFRVRNNRGVTGDTDESGVAV